MELNDKLVEILGQIQVGVTKAGDFALDQLPELAQTYVVYGRARNTAEFLLMLTICLVLALISWKLYVRANDPRTDDGAAFGIPCLMVGLCSGLFALFTAMTMSKMLLVWLAPKVWLLTEITRLIGGAK